MAYQKHIFFCINQKEPGKKCCQNAGADGLREYAKARIQELGHWGKGKIRINAAGCLGRCSEGPAIVIYPDNVWYTYADKSDIDEIIDEHLLRERVVTRLLLE